MNAKLLLEQFDRLSEAPDAIPRLRQFILDLAVQGKLVKQDRRDETATSFLERLAAERNRLVKARLIRDSTALEGRHDEDEYFSAPASWAWCRLSDVGAVIGGGTPPSKDAKNFSISGSGIPWLTPADLGSHKGLYVSRGARDLTEQGLSLSSATLMPKGTVLFTSRAPIGYVAIASNEISTNQGFKSVVPFVPECGRYIALFFQAFAERIDAKAPGTTFREVSGKIVANLAFPLPPLAEQHRIVAKVDELMALCDRLEAAQSERERRRDRLVAASLHRLNTATDPDAFGAAVRFHICHHPRLITREEHLQSVRQTVLELAVTGRLVPQSSDRIPESTQSYQPAARECDEIVSHSAPEELISSDDLQVPSSWAWKSIDDLVAKMDSGWSPQCEATPRGASSTWGVLKTTAVQRLAFSDKENKALPNKLRARPQYEARVGDVLVTRAGPKQRVGVCCVIDKVESRLMISDKIIRLRVLPIVDSAFIAIALNAGRSRWALEQAKSGMAVMQMNISQAKLREVPIPVPPLEEQHRIVARVGEIIAACDHLESQIVAIQTRLRNALNGVLSAATR
ncbi:MAG: restriction endonuclease subunit S [Thermoanaerobaculia bacterium]|jgi:type I restriction enzyme S subunit